MINSPINDDDRATAIIIANWPKSEMRAIIKLLDGKGYPSTGIHEEIALIKERIPRTKVTRTPLVKYVLCRTFRF